MIPNGLLDASTNLALIERFWLKHPTANLAVRTGEESGLVVLDVDPDRDGADSLHELERQHGLLPETGSVVTPRRGQHFYFRWPGVAIKSSVDEIGPGLDVRGDGAYCLIPPSRTEHGSYVYDQEAPPAEMPDWLVEATRDHRDGDGGAAATDPSVWISMLTDGLEDGRRNVSLARLTGYLLRHYVDVDLVAELVHLLNEAKCRPPTPRCEVDRIIDSIAKREACRRRRGR
jgi:hypothetical protein